MKYRLYNFCYHVALATSPICQAEDSDKDWNHLLEYNDRYRKYKDYVYRKMLEQEYLKK